MVLPAVSSNDTFSSLPVISSCARAPPASISRAPAPAPSASSRIVALMVSSRWLCVVGATLPWPSRPRHGGTPMAVAKSRRRHFRPACQLAGRPVTDLTAQPAIRERCPPPDHWPLHRRFYNPVRRHSALDFTDAGEVWNLRAPLDFGYRWPGWLQDNPALSDGDVGIRVGGDSNA